MLGEPTTLTMRAIKKQEIINAVNRALGSLADRLHEITEKEHDELANFSRTLRALSSALPYTNIGTKLIVGRSQQRYVKRFVRQWKIKIEAQKIAHETGASAEQIEKEFLLLLNRYIHP